jgi:TM2 domain-containing membrane protein YozV
MSTPVSEQQSEQALRPPPLPAPAMPLKSPGLAFFLSLLFPGIGQVYNGQPVKAIVFFCGLVAAIYGTTISPMPFAFLIPFVVLYNLVDAWRSAMLINARGAGQPAVEEEPESVWWGASLIVVGALFLLNNLGWFDLESISRYWPVLLIAAGGLILFRSLRKDTGTGSGDVPAA